MPILNCAEAVVHHQTYGFGHSDIMKIGLVRAASCKPENNALEMEMANLPRRTGMPRPSTRRHWSDEWVCRIVHLGKCHVCLGTTTITTYNSGRSRTPSPHPTVRLLRLLLLDRRHHRRHCRLYWHIEHGVHPSTGLYLDDESIVPIKSFDSLHFYDGGNYMVPEQHQQQRVAIALLGIYHFVTTK
jgi:hypothetical protein